MGAKLARPFCDRRQGDLVLSWQITLAIPIDFYLSPLGDFLLAASGISASGGINPFAVHIMAESHRSNGPGLLCVCLFRGFTVSGAWFFQHLFLLLFICGGSFPVSRQHWSIGTRRRRHQHLVRPSKKAASAPGTGGSWNLFGSVGGVDLAAKQDVR